MQYVYLYARKMQDYWVFIQKSYIWMNRKAECHLKNGTITCLFIFATSMRNYSMTTYYT